MVDPHGAATREWLMVPTNRTASTGEGWCSGGGFPVSASRQGRVAPLAWAAIGAPKGVALFATVHMLTKLKCMKPGREREKEKE